MAYPEDGNWATRIRPDGSLEYHWTTSPKLAEGADPSTISFLEGGTAPKWPDYYLNQQEPGSGLKYSNTNRGPKFVNAVYDGQGGFQSVNFGKDTAINQDDPSQILISMGKQGNHYLNKDGSLMYLPYYPIGGSPTPEGAKLLPEYADPNIAKIFQDSANRQEQLSNPDQPNIGKYWDPYQGRFATQQSKYDLFRDAIAPALVLAIGGAAGYGGALGEGAGAALGEAAGEGMASTAGNAAATGTNSALANGVVEMTPAQLAALDAGTLYMTPAEIAALGATSGATTGALTGDAAGGGTTASTTAGSTLTPETYLASQGGNALGTTGGATIGSGLGTGGTMAAEGVGATGIGSTLWNAANSPIGTAVIGAGLGALAGNKGGQEVSQTTTNKTPSQQKDAEQLWNDFIDQFYGTAPGSKSALNRLTEDITANKAAENAYNSQMGNIGNTYLDKTTTAFSPYREQLTKMVNDANNGTGFFTPTSISFGGKPVASFVPRQNRELAKDTAQYGLSNATVGSGLADLWNSVNTAAANRTLTSSLAHPPNEAQNTYGNMLQELMFKMNNGTQTQQGTVPGPSNFANILAGINAATNLYNKVYPWQPAPATAPQTVQQTPVQQQPMQPYFQQYPYFQANPNL